MSKPKFYKVTDIDALREFNPKSVAMVPQLDNALILRMLRDFTHVPGVERIAEQKPELDEAA